jgi:imidazole glycerol-phosphate synthase subunit HisH
MIAVVDYGVNNLRSVVRALAAGGHASVLTVDPDVVRTADRVLVPGVGHFGQAAANLARSGLGAAVREAAASGRPVMGICLGLQLFLESSEEAPGVPGLGLLPGMATRFKVDLPIPHVGWARVEPTAAGRAHGMLRAVLATGDYGYVFPTIVGEGNVIGAQFHPEKSQRAGLDLLGAFARWRS